MEVSRFKTYLTALYLLLWSGIGILLASLLVFAVLRGEDLWSYAIAIGVVLAYFTHAASFDDEAIKEAKKKLLSAKVTNQRFDIFLWLLSYVIVIAPYLSIRSGQIQLTNLFMLVVIALIYLALWLLRPQRLLQKSKHSR